MDTSRPRAGPARARRLRRSVRPPAAGLVALLLAVAVAACQSGLTSAEWLWCKQHPAAIDAAAETLGIAKAAITIEEPSWWMDYLTSEANSNTALIGANADFTASCDQAADEAGVGASRRSWCLSDGLGEAWTASLELGYVVQAEGETFAYKALPLEQRLDNAEFMRACRSAYGSRTG